MITKKAVLYVGIGLAFIFPPARGDTSPKKAEMESEFIDRVYFGNADSEGERVTATNAPVIKGGLDTSARAVAAEDGEISVELECDPQEKTLVTVRMWGGSPGATHIQFAVEGEGIRTAARVSEPMIPGRFFYVTVANPKNLTEGKDSVTLTLTAGNGTPDHVYAAYTHIKNFYKPPHDESQGEPLDAPEPSEPDFDRMRVNLIEAFDKGIDWEKQRQMYGDEFWKRVDAGEVHAGSGSKGDCTGCCKKLRPDDAVVVRSRPTFLSPS